MRLSVKIVYTTLIFFAMPMSLLAQQEGIGNWLMYFGTNRISDHLSIHAEVHYRNHTLAPVNVEQLLLRTGLNYHYSDAAIFTAGYGYVASHNFDTEQSHPESEEHRIWQQFILKNSIKRVNFEHRYRVEQRWVNSDYKNRFRYRLMLFVPLNRKTIEKGTVFIGLYDEVFLNAKKDFFDRNRLYAALGYQLNKSANVQVGMMRQQLSDYGKSYLQVSLTWNTDFRTKTE
jgi:hypothetical protein